MNWLKRQAEMGINLVVPYSQEAKQFCFSTVVPVWELLYPEITSPSVIQSLNSHSNAIGVLYNAIPIAREGACTFEVIGTAFLLAPNFGVASYLETCKSKKGYVYFLHTLKARINESEIAYFHENAAKVTEFHCDDVTGLASEFNITFMDPALQTDMMVGGHGRLDFCFFKMENKSGEDGYKYIIPHFELDFQNSHVATLGVPGAVDRTYTVNHNFPHAPNFYNDYVLASENLGGSYCASIGNIRSDVPRFDDDDSDGRAANRCVAHDCYTHPGSVGSPVISLSHPDRVIGLHIAESIRPHLNVMIPVLNPAFASCYVRYIWPILREIVTGEDKIAFVKYLMRISTRISSAPQYNKKELEEYLEKNWEASASPVFPHPSITTEELLRIFQTPFLEHSVLTPEEEDALINHFHITRGQE